MFVKYLIFFLLYKPGLYIGFNDAFSSTQYECRIVSICDLIWTSHPNQQQLGGVSLSKLDLCGCKQRCAEDRKCVGLDIDDNNLCWLHYNVTTALKNNSNVAHYRLNRTCSNTSATRKPLSNNWDEKFSKEIQKTEILTKLLNSENGSIFNASSIINVLSSIDDVISIMEDNLNSTTKPVIFEKTATLVENCGQLLGQNTASWKLLSREEKSQITGKLFLSVDKCASLLSRCKPDGRKKFALNASNIFIEIISSLGADEFVQSESHTSSQFKSNLRISRKNLGNASNLILVSYANVDHILSETSNDVTKLRNDTTVNACGEVASSNSNMELNSNVMSATILNGALRSVSTLVDPVNISFHHLKANKGIHPICVFWNYSLNKGEGGWSSQGCRVTSKSENETICSCDHLTNFAILMSFTDHVLSEEAEYGLSMMTYIGCAISLVCLLFAFITFTVFRTLQCDRNSIHKNLVICLFVAELIFFLGIDQICIPILCTIVAIFLHYFFLCSFMWMCMEGFQLYILLIHVFNAEKSRMNIFYPVAYGIPAVTTAICISIGLENYGTKNYCWLEKENGFIWAFIGPVIFILIINLHMLIITMVTMCRLSTNTPVHKKESEKKFRKILAWIKSALVLMVLLGSTWIVGLFYIGQTTVVMAYIFTILNSLQGFFIFVCHCLMNKKVRKEYRKCWQRLPFSRTEDYDFWKSSKDANKQQRRGTDASYQTCNRATDTEPVAFKRGVYQPTSLTTSTTN